MQNIQLLMQKCTYKKKNNKIHISLITRVHM